jgi:hypothetical protein
LKLPFIVSEDKDVLRRLDDILGSLKARGQEHASFTIAIDGTAVMPIREVSHKYGAIMGGAHPDHFVKIPEGSSNEELKALLFDNKAVLAKEVKTVVVAIQNVPAGVRSFYILCLQPHGKNESSSFNVDLMKCLAEYSEKTKSFTLLNAAVNGVSCNSGFVVNLLENFLSRDTNWLGITDPNHNAKNFWYQAIGGSSIAGIGGYFVDADLLRVSGVPI